MTYLDRTCQYCQKSFRVTPARANQGKDKFCSHSCYSKSLSRETVTVECENCGKSFKVLPSRFKHGRGKYCSRQCQYQITGRKISTRLTGKIIQASRVTRTCPTCSKTFEVVLSDKKIYCSARCAQNDPGVRNKIRESFTPNPAAQKKMTATMRLPLFRWLNSLRAKLQWQDTGARKVLLDGIKGRSQSPEWRNAPQFQRGEKHPRYKGTRGERQVAMGRYQYSQWRKAIFERDNYTCQQCGKCGGRLNAHHIKEWKNFPELRYALENGITLCATCHKKIPPPK